MTEEKQFADLAKIENHQELLEKYHDAQRQVIAEFSDYIEGDTAKLVNAVRQYAAGNGLNTDFLD
jgi:hypothetical protein